MKTDINEKIDDVNNRKARTLYVRLPHTIHNADEVQDLFPITVEVKLLRQSSRNCHVVFPTIEDKLKNLELVKEKVINGKKVYVSSLNDSFVKKKLVKKPEKKLVIPEPKPEMKITQTIYVSNINKKSKIADLKKVFGDVTTIAFINKTDNPNNTKEAIVKLADGKLAAEYLKKERSPPSLHGNKLVIKPDKRKKKKKKPSNSS